MANWQNNKKLKLLIIVGTRPEIIRLSEIIKKCRIYFDTLVAHTGQNYDYCLSEVFFKDLNLGAPDIYMGSAEEDSGKTIGNIIANSYSLMKSLNPDAVLVLGDTNSCLSVISAKRLHIPVFHMEAGNRCKDEKVPEEINRTIVDAISDINIAYTEHARRNLIDSGFPMNRAFVVGSPMLEVVKANIEEILKSDVHERMDLEEGRYILLSVHREENLDIDNRFKTLFSAINKVAEKYDLPILFSCHPRSNKRLLESGFKLDDRIIKHEPLGFYDYHKLQLNAFAVISDSGTLPEESSIYASMGYSFPAVCIRTSTEHPESLEHASFILSGIDEAGLLQAIDIAVSMAENEQHGGATPVPDYLDTNVSGKIVKIIQSYTGVVNKLMRSNDY